MSAAALRHPEVEEHLASSPTHPAHPSSHPADASMEWSETAEYVDRFIGADAELDRARRRRLLRRHKSFASSSSTLIAGALLLVQVVALVSLKAAELKVVRVTSKLDRQIQQTSLQIALTQKKLADYNSLPRLDAWAKNAEEPYHKATQVEMDDVTSNAPLPASNEDREASR
jgi:cell division protein FtsL